MYLALITLIIAVLLTAWFIARRWMDCCGNEKTVKQKIWLCIYPWFVALIAWTFGTELTAVTIGNFISKESIPSYKQEIYAIGDGFPSEGHFFLGCGTIKEVPYYFYYEKTAKGGYKQAKIEVTDDVEIVEKDSVVPYIQHYDYKFSNKYWENWAIVDENKEITIVVPKGSVKQNYNFDLN